MFECELGKNPTNNFICHLLQLEKLTPPHTPLHGPPHPTPSWPIWPHPYMTHPPFPVWSTPPHSTPTWPTPPHPYMTHPTPTPTWPTPPYLHPTPPHPWYIFGHKGAFFHGLLHYVSLLVDKKCRLTVINTSAVSIDVTICQLVVKICDPISQLKIRWSSCFIHGLENLRKWENIQSGNFSQFLFFLWLLNWSVFIK